MYAWTRHLNLLIACWVLMVLAPRNVNAQRSDSTQSEEDLLDLEFGHSFTQQPKPIASFISLETESRVEPPELDLELPPQAPPDPELFGGRIRSLVKSAGVSVTHLAGGGSDPLGITDVSVRASIFTPTPLKKVPFLIVSPSFTVRSLDAPTALGLPSELYSTSLSVTWMHKWSDRTTLVLGVGGGVYSDFEATNSAFRLTGHAMSTTQLNDHWEMMLGVVILNQNNLPALPVAGFVYKPDSDTRIELAAPRPRFAKRVHWLGGLDSGEDWAYIAGEFDGGRYAVMRPGGVEDTVNFQDFRLVAGMESKRRKGVNTQVEAGYVFGRNVSFEDDLTEYEPSNTFMFRAGLSY